MINIDEAKFWEEKRHEEKWKMLAAKFLRDLHIRDAFTEGHRHKEIGNALGLSESRVKHIILELKKKENQS